MNIYLKPNINLRNNPLIEISIHEMFLCFVNFLHICKDVF